jgi:FlaA1/EpsC-like NDP-sugar epimerase
MAKGGEIFVLDMGEPVRIMDLAKNLITLSGLKPYEDIDIEITGLRPGEKLFEELLMNPETNKATQNKKIFIEKPTIFRKDKLCNEIEEMKRKIENMGKEEVKDMLAEMVPTFKR